MLARIYKPAKSAMQSGQGRAQDWVLEFAPEQAKRIDPLMGWTGSGDMRGQVKLEFESKAAAMAYAQKHGIPAQVFEPKTRKPNVRARGYGSNFAHDRRGAWTH
ncbi:MAG: ETC complex I subunit [Pseudomonadota bacterium]